jgi:hypothetical protein
VAQFGLAGHMLDVWMRACRTNAPNLNSSVGSSPQIIQARPTGFHSIYFSRLYLVLIVKFTCLTGVLTGHAGLHEHCTSGHIRTLYNEDKTSSGRPSTGAYPASFS